MPSTTPLGNGANTVDDDTKNVDVSATVVLPTVALAMIV